MWASLITFSCVDFTYGSIINYKNFGQAEQKDEVLVFFFFFLGTVKHTMSTTDFIVCLSFLSLFVL
jgi:hypothetical protein